MADIEWTEWSGGECPVDELAWIEVKLRDGAVWKNTALAFDFSHIDNDAENDIVAYRVLA